jgi:small-conductance mechanosensitive channel
MPYTALRMADHETARRLRRALWAAVAFLCGFAALIVIVGNYYLVPALDAAHTADTAGKRQISAFSMLLLAVILFTLIIGLLMTFSIRRFFFPTSSKPVARTEHIDAWAESAKRMATPKRDDSHAEDEWDELSDG